MSGDAASGRLLPGARWYAGQGWKVFPCYGIVAGRCECGATHPEPKDIGKHPRISRWNDDATSEIETVDGWWRGWPEANIGVFCKESGFLVVDIDPRNGGLESWPLLESAVGGLPDTVEAWTGEYTTRTGVFRGRHLFYRVEDGESLRAGIKGMPGIDIKHNGYVLINPSRHASGVVYEWAPGKAPWEIGLEAAPEELLAMLRKRPRGMGGGAGGGIGVLEWGGEKIDVDALLAEGIAEGERVVTLYRIACAVANTLGVKTEMQKAAVRATMRGVNSSHVHPPLSWENELEFQVNRAIAFVESNPKAQFAWAGIEDWKKESGALEWAEEAGKGRGVEITALPVREAADVVGAVGGGVVAGGGGGGGGFPADKDAVDESDGGEPGSRSLTDLGNGRRIIDYAGATLRYTVGLGWFVWGGDHWIPDAGETLVQEIAKRLPVWIVSEIARADKDREEALLKWATKAKTIATRRAALQDALTDPRISVPVQAWDSQSHLLGVRNGIINLRTGELLKPVPELYITKRSRVAYTPGHRTVRWEEFLDFATGGDKELQRYLQLAAGYTLTGDRNHEVLFLVHGPAGSGKSTLLEVLGSLLGDYFIPLDSDVLVEAGGGGAGGRGSLEYYMAQLLGKRMIGISEWPDARATKEESVKRLTGDLSITGRHPGERPFTFESRAKLWVGTNSKPRINDPAMWRRIRAIHFSHVPEKPDPELKPFLLDPEGGLPAALSWAVEGAVRLLGSTVREPLGLGACRHVAEATEEYKRSEDRVGLFLDDETRAGSGLRVAMADLHRSYSTWCEHRGEKPQTWIAFRRRLEERGVVLSGKGRDEVVEGFALKPRVVSGGVGGDWASLVDSAR